MRRKIWWALALAVLLGLLALLLQPSGGPADPAAPAPEPVTLAPPAPASTLPRRVGADPPPPAEHEADRVLSEAMGYAWVECPPPRGEFVSGWNTDLPYRRDPSGLAFSTADAEGTFYVRRSFEDPTVVSLLRWSVGPDGEASCEQTDADLVDTVLRVVDPSGDPVAGVSVGFAPMVQGVDTDADGRVSFPLAAGDVVDLSLTWTVEGGGGAFSGGWTRFDDLPSVRIRAGERREVTVNVAEVRPFEERRAADLVEKLARAEEEVAAIDQLLAAPDVPEALRAHWTERRRQQEVLLMVRGKELLPDGTLPRQIPRKMSEVGEEYGKAGEQLEAEGAAN